MLVHLHLIQTENFFQSYAPRTDAQFSLLFFSCLACLLDQGTDPRPEIIYSSLQFLDLVLIRSRVTVNGFGMDSRIASTIRYGSLGLQIPQLQQLSKWDRVGLIQLPSFIEKHEYDADNIEVTEATYFGIQTRTLRQVIESSMEVSIRSLKLGKQIEQHEEELRRLREAAKNKKNKKIGEKKESNVGESSMEAAASPSPDMNGDPNLGDEDESDDANNERLEYLQKYYQFTGPIINRTYGQCMDKLEAMFRYVMASLRSFDLAPIELSEMDKILDKYVTTFTGPDGQTRQSGIPFQSLLPLFRDISSHDSHTQNTFSDAEMYELVGSFTTGDDRVSLSNTGFMTKQEFMQQWRASLERTLPLRRIPREILSGAFVSQALQNIGILPQSSDAYYLPMEFAMLEAPEGLGWPQDDWSQKRKAEEAKKLQAALEEEQHLHAHLPKFTGQHSIVTSPSFQSSSLQPSISNASSSSSSSSSSDHSLRVDGATVEGAAIQRIHAHGVARIGIEQQVPQPPPQKMKEDSPAVSSGALRS